jgi:hypothetical protein
LTQLTTLAVLSIICQGASHRREPAATQTKNHHLLRIAPERVLRQRVEREEFGCCGPRGTKMHAGEIWTWRDIQRGRWLTIILFAAIVAKEVAVVIGLEQGLVAAGTTLPPATLPFIAHEAIRAGSAFGLSLVFMILAYGGRNWARYCLGLNYLFLSGWAGFSALHAVDAVHTNASKFALGNAALGLVIGFLLIFLTSLRAFAWYQANRRPANPVPLDDQPAHRAKSRELTFGETVARWIRRIAMMVMALIGIAILAVFYGFGGTILHWIRP